VVGLPYASKTDPELQARMAYLDSQKSTRSEAGSASISGDEYYRDLCMKAVNQSIGRSIRHAKDFAAIVLCDERYENPDIQARLPKWISERSLRSFTSFGTAFAALRGTVLLCEWFWFARCSVEVRFPCLCVCFEMGLF
jgi:chromosome transmission fidelity protein 1